MTFSRSNKLAPITYSMAKKTLKISMPVFSFFCDKFVHMLMLAHIKNKVKNIINLSIYVV